MFEKCLPNCELNLQPTTEYRSAALTENGAISAIKEVYPLAQIVGCFFHYRQCLLRKAKELNINIEMEPTHL